MPIYSGEHSITFGEKNTWDDWHLIPSSRPVFSPPQPNIRLLNIPGKSGSLDVTDLFGQVVYADRTGSFEFYVDHETEFPETYVDEDKAGKAWDSWADAYQEIMAYLQGQKLKATLKDDLTFYYEGRFSVNEWRSNPNFSTIVINYTVQPYKMKQYDYGWDWIWDETDFDTRSALLCPMEKIDLNAAGVNGKEIILEGYGYRTIPLIVCSESGVQLFFDNYDPVTLSVGENRPSIAVLTTGEHKLRFLGGGTIDIHYRGGAL